MRILLSFTSAVIQYPHVHSYRQTYARAYIDKHTHMNTYRMNIQIVSFSCINVLINSHELDEVFRDAGRTNYTEFVDYVQETALNSTNRAYQLCSPRNSGLV